MNQILHAKDGATLGFVSIKLFLGTVLLVAVGFAFVILLGKLKIRHRDLISILILVSVPAVNALLNITGLICAITAIIGNHPKKGYAAGGIALNAIELLVIIWIYIKTDLSQLGRL